MRSHSVTSPSRAISGHSNQNSASLLPTLPLQTAGQSLIAQSYPTHTPVPMQQVHGRSHCILWGITTWNCVGELGLGKGIHYGMHGFHQAHSAPRLHLPTSHCCPPSSLFHPFLPSWDRDLSCQTQPQGAKMLVFLCLVLDLSYRRHRLRQDAKLMAVTWKRVRT